MSLAGAWVNEYGSKMELTVTGGTSVFGTYASTTGSTGTYVVVGCQQPAEPTSTQGQAVALAIAWRSIAAGAADPSWHWCSGLSGQISVQDGADSLVLAHAMVATDDFADLAQTGVYIDKLTYSRTSDASAAPFEEPDLGAPATDPLAGTWTSADGAVLTLQVHPYPGGAFGVVSGSMASDGGSCTIRGVTDVNAQAGGLMLQSVALTALLDLDGPAVGLAGSLDLTTGLLTTTHLSSQSTAPAATYAQTQVSSRMFSKRSDEK